MPHFTCADLNSKTVNVGEPNIMNLSARENNGIYSI